MIAIRLTQANLHKILNESPIPRPNLEAMIEEYDTVDPDKTLFFVPQADDADELRHNSWMTLPAKAMVEMYSYDPDKINTQFVEITPK